MKKVLREAGAIAALVLLPLSTAFAQNIDLATGGADQIWHGTAANANAGVWLDQGPINTGDTRRDLIIGAPGSATVGGKLYVIFAGPVPSGNISLATANVTISGTGAGDAFGTATAIGGVKVLDSAANPNLAVGSPGALSNRGAVYLFNGGIASGSSLTTANATFTVLGAPGDRLGSAIATGDINGDGYRELIIGAPGNNRVYVIVGGNTLSGTRDLSVTAADVVINGAGIGSSVQSGDVTGDGVSEILIGSAAQNKVYLLTGSYPSPSTLPADADVVFSGIDPGDEAGAAIRLADLDGDGKRDIIIGAPSGDGPTNTRGNAGEAYVIWGRAAYSSMSLSSADVTIYGAGAGHRLGEGMTAGDINRDTPNDVVFLAPGAAAAGELHVFYGRSRSAFGSSIDLASVGASRRIIGDPAAGPLVSAQVYEVTGEGARDVIVGVPAAETAAGRIYFTISPKMTVNPTTITRSLSQGQTTSVAVSVDNLSTISITYNAADNQAWLSESPASGSSVIGTSGMVNVNISTSGLAVGGPYTGTVTVTSTSPHLTMTRSIPVSLTVTAPTAPPPNPDASKNDFNGDGKMDILWENMFDGYLAIWTMNGPNLVSSDLLTPHYVTDTNWKIVGTGDFNADGKPDIVWQEQTQGWVGIWLMNGLNLLSSTTLSPAGRDRVADTNWKIAGVLDLNGDNKPDILWQEQTQGWIGAWLLNGTTVTSSVALSPERVSDTNWKIMGNGDMNADGKPDLIWQNISTGYLAVWYMNGLSITDSVLITPHYISDNNWKIVAAGDMDGDGKSDLVWQEQTQGWIGVWLMNGVNLTGSFAITPERVSDTHWKIVGPK